MGILLFGLFLIVIFFLTIFLDAYRETKFVPYLFVSLALCFSAFGIIAIF